MDEAKKKERKRKLANRQKQLREVKVFKQSPGVATTTYSDKSKGIKFALKGTENLKQIQAKVKTQANIINKFKDVEKRKKPLAADFKLSKDEIDFMNKASKAVRNGERVNPTIRKMVILRMKGRR